MRLVGEVAVAQYRPHRLVMVREIVQAVEIATQPLLENSQVVSLSVPVVLNDTMRLSPSTRIRHISIPGRPTPRWVTLEECASPVA